MVHELRNVGKKVATAMIFAGFATGAAFAQVANTIDVTLPDSVTVGKTVLPRGDYKVNEVPFGSGESMFLFYNANGAPAAVTEGVKGVSPPQMNDSGVSAKTELVLRRREDGTTRLDEMFIQGYADGYMFVNRK